MKKVFLWVAAAMMVAMSVHAQQIQVVDSKGEGIPLVSVLTDEGNLIGTTDLSGVLADVKGAKKVTLTHVAYRPQQVTVAKLKDGRITLQEVDYNLTEIVVKPKPYIYVETYYRFYAFINDSLRFYQAGIMPNAYNLKKKKVETGSHNNCYGDFYPNMGVGVTWGARVMEYHAGRVHTSHSKKLQPGGTGNKRYFLTLSDDGQGRQSVNNPEGTVGYIVKANGQMRTTLDGGKMQMYSNKALGQDKQLKRREEKAYDYQFTEIFNLDEDGESSIEDFVMDTNHWEWNGSKGRYKMIIESYSIERGYMDEKEFKAKKKELKENYPSPMTLTRLETIAANHGIPALDPAVRSAIEKLSKK